ncbi:hypothetical protein BBJ28_00024225 [Nothophytophthora sp. Chile5]|nr:hypothetical protein BBJ28_00024225 [Nothophytophthora sp. Chile5]
MKFSSFLVTFLTIAGSVHADLSSNSDVAQFDKEVNSAIDQFDEDVQGALGHAVRGYHGGIGSWGDSGSHGELHIHGDDEDTVVFPTPKPTDTNGELLPTPAPSKPHHNDHSPTPAPTVSGSDSEELPTPAPTTSSGSYDLSSVEQSDFAVGDTSSAVGVAYSTTREEVEAKKSAASSYTVPIVAAGCVAGVLAIAAFVVIQKRRKLARQPSEGEVDYSGEIATPV